MNITDTWLKHLKPKKEPLEVPDPSCRGLRIRITPTGVKSFVYNYSSPIDKKTKRVKLGNYPTMTLKRAREKWGELSDLRKQGTDPQQHLKDIHQERVIETERRLNEEKGEQAPTVTINKLIDLYIDQSSAYLKTWREQQRVLKKEFGLVYGSYPAHDITREQIRVIVNAKREEGKNTQAWRIIAHIRSMFNWAIESPELFPTPFTINPATMAYSRQERKRYKPKPRTRRWHEDELKTILSLFPDDHHDLLTFILLTGSRFGEATAMKWSELYKEEWRQKDTKTDNDHTVFLSTQAQAILDKQPKVDDFVWSNPNTNSGHVRQDSVHIALRRIDFGIDHWTVHDFRRAISSWLGRQGVLKEINDRMLNHTNAGVYETYNQESYDEPAREWWQKWGDYIEELSNGKVTR